MEQPALNPNCHACMAMEPRKRQPPFCRKFQQPCHDVPACAEGRDGPALDGQGILAHGPSPDSVPKETGFQSEDGTPLVLGDGVSYCGVPCRVAFECGAYGIHAGGPVGWDDLWGSDRFEGTEAPMKISEAFERSPFATFKELAEWAGETAVALPRLAGIERLG